MLAALVGLLPIAQDPAAITTRTLIAEAYDLGRLARPAAVPYENVQFSSFDRRSVSRDAPGWFANSDGFGREPVPGFLRTLAEPDASGRGRYLLAKVDGPGAIVRGWTAGMGGHLTVTLDGAAEPVFEGRAETFLRERTRWFLHTLGREDETANAFMQEDADYLPVPFARGLRITWEGRLRDLHFYQLQVRRYAPGARVVTFDAARDLADLARATRELTRPRNRYDDASRLRFEAKLRAGTPWRWSVPGRGRRALTELQLRVEAAEPRRALRGTLLRIAFDGASVPQVEAPLGDFFGTGPGVQPYGSLPFTVAPDGRMSCRFVMPFRRRCTVELVPSIAATVHGRVTVTPWQGEHFYFRAKWRVDHDLVADSRAVVDLPYAIVLGKGRLVGVACMLMNPSGVPTPGGNWWGEGDEKIFVDGGRRPAIFGTGSEDYFNYSWSRPGLFAHPYCGQPLTSGPGTSGYVSNHRYQILDDVPFERSLAFFMELKHHRRTPGLSYARVTYYYAARGAVDDHRALMPRDLAVPELPERRPVAAGGARGAVVRRFRDMRFASESGVALVPARLAPSKTIAALTTTGSARVATRIALPEAGHWAFRLVAAHRPDGGLLRVAVGGRPLRVRGTSETSVALRARHGTRFLNVYYEPVECKAGANDVVLEALEPGFYGFDYFWIQKGPKPARRVPGAHEGEDLAIVARSPRLETERQGMDGRWSGGRHLWVRASAPGQFVEVAVPVSRAGRYRVQLRYTKSWDYGIVQAAIGGRDAGPATDTFNTSGRAVGLLPLVDLGVHEADGALRLRLTVTGAHPKAEGPRHFFGLDYVLLRPID